MHAVAARSTLGSQNSQNIPYSEHFWKLRCSKSVRPCGAKHISKSKCTKHHMFVPLLDVKASFCVAGARDSPPCQTWAKRGDFCSRFNYNHHNTTPHTPLHSTPLHPTPLDSTTTTATAATTATLLDTTLHYTTLHSTTLRYTPLHYTPLHYTQLHFTSLHYTTLHCTALHLAARITLHYTALRYTN